MIETKIPELSKEDIKSPLLEPGATAIILQRHERYDRDRAAERSGSLFEEDAQAAKDRMVEFFNDVLDHEDNGESIFLFTSSDTQYNGKGYRSLETAQIAQDAAIEVLTAHGIDPVSRIINLSPDFRTDQFVATGQDVRPMPKLREPDIFETPAYVKHLKDKYGTEDGPGGGLSKQAWAAHEADAEQDVREELGGEGVHHHF